MIQHDNNLSGKAISYDVYLCHTQEMCILGRLDNNCICCLSFSSALDSERTQAVIDNMTDSPCSRVFREHDAIDANLHKIGQWYHLNLTKKIRDGDVLYHAPEAECYFPRRHMGTQIKNAFSNLVKICEVRVADGEYLNTLRKYQRTLSLHSRRDAEAADYYCQMKPLIKIVEAENYIRLSPDAEARGLYQSLVKSAEELYGAYMDKYR